MNEWMSIDTAQAITLYVFLFLITLALFVFFVISIFELILKTLLGNNFYKRTENWKDERTLQKFIGGLSVFVVAIISQNAWVMGLSLFIGGLIIASERFMRALAIIMKSQSQDLPRALGALTGLESSDASPHEIEEKIAEEAKETAPPSPNIGRGKFSAEESRRRFEERKKLTEQAEKAVTKFFLSFALFGDRYRPQVKISNQYGTIIADGALYDHADREKLTHLAEIKYVGGKENDELLFSEMGFWARRTLERFRFLLIPNSVIYAIVGKDFTKKTAENLGKQLDERLKGQIWTSVFNLQENGEVEPLYPSELSSPITTTTGLSSQQQ